MTLKSRLPFDRRSTKRKKYFFRWTVASFFQCLVALLRATHSGLLANELFISIGKKSSVPVNDKVSSAQETVSPPVADDPYKKFLAEQNAWELQLDADREAKQAKLHSAEQTNVAEQKVSGAETDQAPKRTKLHKDGAEESK